MATEGAETPVVANKLGCIADVITDRANARRGCRGVRPMLVMPKTFYGGVMLKTVCPR